MKIKTNTLNELNIQTTGVVSNMKLDEHSHAMIFQMFTGGLYSDPIGTVIREITSNCFDSHVEAGVNNTKNPVVVELTKEISGNFITFKDKGVGMSPDRIINVYGTYFKTTKDKTNDQIGGFGLGGKTPLAYTDSFYIVTRFEGVEYTYNVFEGNNVPAIELMSQSSTKQPNGTDVKIPVKESDVNEFEQKTLRQLYYFENIVFKGFTDRHVTNDYSIVKGKNFLFRGHDYSKKMHVCYGKVAYPIDFDAMGLDQHKYELAVAVRIEIGELEGTGVTPSREAIKYSKENIKIIKAKMDAVVEELKDLLGKQYTNVTTLVDYYRAVDEFGTLYFDNDRTLYVGNLIKQSDVTYPNFKFSDLRIPKQDEIIEKFYNKKLYGKKPSTRSWRSNEWSGSLKSMNEFNNIYFIDGYEFKRKVVKQSYFRTLSKTENFYVLCPINLDITEYMKELMKSFGVLQEVLNDDSLSDKVEYKVLIPKKRAEELIRTLYTELHELVKSQSEGNYDELEVPDDFLIARKQQRLSDDILKTTIAVKNGYYGSRERVTLKNLQDLRGKIYYGFNNDSYNLRNCAGTFKELIGDSGHMANVWDLKKKDTCKGTLFISISKGNEKYMKMLGKKAIHVDYFYQTFITRKIDKIVEGKVNKIIENKFNGEVLELFSDKNFKLIDENVYDTAIKIKTLLDNVDAEYGWNVNAEEVKNKLKIDIKNIDAKFKMEKELNDLIKLTKVNRDRFKWFNLPHNIEVSRNDHKELVEMIRLMFKK